MRIEKEVKGGQIMTKNNIGFNYEKELAEQSKKDWVFGSKDSKKISGLADKVGGLITALFAWPNPIKGIYPRVTNGINHAIDMISEACKKYLPDGTVQRGKEDWMNCASNAPCNEVEKQCNYAVQNKLFSPGLIEWIKEKGYINPENGLFEIADAFVSIGSGTTEVGNSIKAPLEFIVTKGIIPKSMLPDNQSMTFNEYHNPDRITQEMWDLGEEFIEKKVLVNFEIVYNHDFANFLGNLKWEIFDSYVDRVDGDFIKRLAPDYIMIGYGYRVIINEILNPKKKMTLAKLKQIYEEILLRPWTELKDGIKYLKYDEDFVRAEVKKSDERKKIEWVANILRTFKII